MAKIINRFTSINKTFLHFHAKKYRVLDVIVNTFWTPEHPILTEVAVYFVVRTEKQKFIFLEKNMEKCSEAYLTIISRYPVFDGLSYKFYVLSKEEIRKKYNGNYAYAIQ